MGQNTPGVIRDAETEQLLRDYATPIFKAAGVNGGATKIILIGDPAQIDNPYVDWRSNALTRIKQAYRGFGPFVAQVRLVKNYRGPISTKADEL